ncbi:MAG: diphthine--ammonia ligase [Deltaproteobacteria bacterium]|nr:diphthine--ammonia ligase [Deltaproteobacteria bacterium]
MEENKKLKAFVSWSGGKDAALSYYRAMKQFEVTHLLNMTAEDGKRSRSHGVRTGVIQKQAEAMGLTVIQPRSSWETYEEEFKKAVLELKQQEVGAGIFGDIDLEGHREWVERVSSDVGISAVLPIWKEKREVILREFIEAGFEAIVVAVKKDVLGDEWLGRTVDSDFINDMLKIEDVDISGENGEYHTLVLSGPVFERRINIIQSEKIIRDEHCFLDISACEVVGKLPTVLRQ